MKKGTDPENVRVASVCVQGLLIRLSQGKNGACDQLDLRLADGCVRDREKADAAFTRRS